MKIRELVKTLDDLAPRNRAENWDNVGLIAGDDSAELTGIAISLDLSESLIKEAIAKKANLIIVHHPPFINPLKRINLAGKNGRLMASLIRNDITCFCMHTNFDVAQRGFFDWYKSEFNLSKTRFLSSPAEGAADLCKLSVFVPKEHVEKVSNALFDAGCGHIGNYSNCSFRTEGTGSFMPLEGTNPYIGHKRITEQVREEKLEVILPRSIERKAISAMKSAHPYEEVAYDVYPLSNKDPRVGYGILGSLEKELKLNQVIDMVNNSLNPDHLKIGGRKRDKIKKIAVLPGSGAFSIGDAAHARANLLITSDMKYHDWFRAEELDLCIINVEHYISEGPFASIISDYIGNVFSKEKVFSYYNKSDIPIQAVKTND